MAGSTLRSRRHRNPQQSAENPQAEQQPFFAAQNANAVQAKQHDGAFFQPKLRVGQVGDPYEREADAVADRVANQPTAKTAPSPQESSQTVQRLATPDEKNMPATNDSRMAQDKMIQEKPADKKEEEKPIQKAEAKKEEEKPIQKAEAKKEEEKPIQKAEAKKEEEKPIQKAEAKKEEEKPIQKAEAKKEEEKPNIQKGNKGTPRNNEAQNKQFNDAVQEIQRKIGRKLTDGERQRLHHEISGQDFSYQEIVEHGVAMFRKK
jgi:hypothetical protein